MNNLKLFDEVNFKFQNKFRFHSFSAQWNCEENAGEVTFNIPLREMGSNGMNIFLYVSSMKNIHISFNLIGGWVKHLQCFQFYMPLTLKSFEINWSSLPFLVFLMTSLEKCVVSQTDFIDFKIIPYFNSAFFQYPSLLLAERRGEVQLFPMREIMIKYKKWLNWFMKKIQKAYRLLNTTSVDILYFRYISYTSSFDKSCK